ncbi:MAG: metal ABC transporter substrate-binding protein [Mariniblastus sp.]|nr:metal ABC transporter substrate-binding protein [Mariniblastus sp.]
MSHPIRKFGKKCVAPYLLGLAFLAASLAGCTNDDSAAEPGGSHSGTSKPLANSSADTVAPGESATNKRVILCSTTQCADFAKQVVGDRWEVKCVLGPGQDPHMYEPRVADSEAVANADLCVRNGWNLEGHEWMKTLAENAGKPLVTCATEVTPLMTSEDQTIKDPHTWFNPANAWKYTKQIRDEVIRLDPARADEYTARAELYRSQLRELENWIQQQVNSIPEPRVLVTHHDAFGYFCDRYGFQAVTPVGWTTDEISGATIADRQEVIKQIQDLKVRSIFVESTLNRQMIESIAKEAGVNIGGELYSDAMGGPGTAGEDYIGMMRENILILVDGLK